MSSLPIDLTELEERLAKAAGVNSRVSDGRLELLPTTVKEAARAEAARGHFDPDGSRTLISLAAFAHIEAPDPITSSVKVGASAQLADVEAALRSAGLTLGWLSPKARALSVRAWIEGPYAGLRVIPGNRLESAALSLSVSLRGGGLYQGIAAPRSAVGPVLEGLILGCGGQVGALLEVQLRALGRPEVVETVHAGLERPEEVAQLVRAALQRDVPVVEVQVRRKARGYTADLVVASLGFRASRDRAALEQLAKDHGELRTMRRVEERELPFEGELPWERLPWAVAQGGPLTLYRLARESLVIAAEGPVKGALALDRAPEPLPTPFLSALALRPPEVA